MVTPTKEYNGRSRIRMYNVDSRDFMNQVDNDYYDLAICDPPYGINYDGNTTVKGKAGKANTFSNAQHHVKKDWDSERPSIEHFSELHRVSKNQIIWGGNYFADLLPPKKGWVFWDKKITNANNTNFSDGELAWTSFDCILRRYTYDWIGFGYLNNPQKEKKTHPTQKPVQLYKWLLENYAEHNQKIFDGWGGSMSIAIACWDLGFDLDICEMDTDYFNDAVKRFENHITQTQLF